jgi:hypothetical protein
MTMPPQSPLEYEAGFRPGRGNGAAIASLVLGILGCVPVLTGVLAIALGIIGLRKTRDPAVTGKGMAIAGLTLGIVSLLGWATCGGLLGYGYVESRPADAVAKQFLQDVDAGNINAATANSIGITAAQLLTNNQQMKQQFGDLKTINLTSFNFSAGISGQSVMHIGGTATYTKGQKNCTFDLVKVGGIYKVTSYWVQ